MKEKTEKAVQNLIKKNTNKEIKPDEALKFSQAALNLAHTFQVWQQTTKN